MTTHIQAELLLASKNAATGDILYSLRLTYPRIIHSEFMTHRVFSRNSSSSRAIPGKKFRKQVLTDPFIPWHLGRKQKGMTAGADITGWRRTLIQGIWAAARYPAVAAAWAMEKTGVAKQIANRVLEPWTWMTVVASATDLQNFLKLRTHKDAEPHIQELAKRVEILTDFASSTFRIMQASGMVKHHTLFNGTLQILQPGEWHLPLLTDHDLTTGFYSLEEKKLMSAARCVRTSYTLIEEEKKPRWHIGQSVKDLGLGEKLVASDPLHASPLEHQAQAMDTSRYVANFKGWHQYRHFLPNHDGDK